MNFIYEHAPTVSLLFFFTVFLWVAYRAYRPQAKQELEAHAYIPLSEDPNEQSE